VCSVCCCLHYFASRIIERSLVVFPFAEEPFRRVAAQFLNVVVAGQHTPYWKDDIRAALIQKFPKLLSPEEMDPSFNLYNLCLEFLPPSMLRLSQFLNIDIREGVLTSSVTGLVRATLALETDSFEFITSDILHIGCRTKHLNVIDKVVQPQLCL
jgi:hypothetical protein